MNKSTTAARLPAKESFESCRFVTTTDLWHIWQGVLKSDAAPVIIKICRDDLDIDRERMIRLVERSERLQQHLDPRFVLRPVQVDVGPETLTVAYPFLSPDTWRSLTATLFWSHFPYSLTGLAFVIDYLHHYRLVHGDIKRGNFMCRVSGGRFEIRLIDNDFVRAEFDPTQALILGTPSHIAPEILANERPAVESDVYSCGALLRDLLSSEDAPDGGDVKERLTQLCDRCLENELTRRPRSLLSALKEFKFLEDTDYQSSLRKLMKRIGAGQVRTMLRAGGARGRLMRRLLQEVRLFGVPEELLNDFSDLLKNNSVRFGRIASSVLAAATLDRTPDYWRIAIPDDTLLEAVRQLRCEPGWPLETATDITPVALLERAAALSKEGEYLSAYLCLKQLLPNSQQLLVLARGGQVPESLLREVYTIISQVRRPDDFLPLFERLYTDKGIADDLRLAVGLLLVRSLALVVDVKRCLALAREMTDLARSLDDDDTRFALMRHEAYCLASIGERDVAGELLNQLVDETRHSGNDEQLGHALMELSRLASHGGDHGLALQRLYDLEKLSGTMQFAPATMISMHLGFAMHFYQTGRYRKVLQHCREGMRQTEAHRLHFHRALLVFYKSMANMRLAKYDEALQNLQSSVSDRTDLPGIVGIASYLKNLGTINLARGRLFEARQLMAQAYPIIGSIQSAVMLQYWSTRLELLLLCGEREKVVHAYATAREICETQDVKSSLSEFDGLKLLDRLHNEPESVRPDDLDIIDRLLADGHRLLASRLLTLLMLSPQAEVRGAAHTRTTAMSEDEQLESSVPTAILLDKINRTVKDSTERRVDLLKESYVIASRSGGLDIATALCRTLGEHYLAQRSAKVARRYFEAAQRHARDMGNTALTDRYGCIADSVAVGPVAQTLVRSVRAMSGILASLEDRAEASAKLIRYAVDLTGAERGVLFRQTSDRLRPTAYVSCDHDELKDIADFSRSIVATSTGELRTVAIDNAVEDDRTNHFRSVLAHNIRAVVCAPIVRDGVLIGALYLDHHNLPGLFTEDDIRTVETVANFLAVCEMTADRISALSASNENMRERLRTAGYDTEFVGDNGRIREMLSMLPRIAGTTAPVLIYGETGTGKECLAEIVHSLSVRSRRPLVKLNCAAIAPSLIDSELFGVAPGTATGVSAKAGKFESADGGTLFLDEIGDMPPEIQAKVLRVLESQQFQRVGSNKLIDTDVRFIYATNKNLEHMVKDGSFRRDLYYRIQTFQIEIPPLRQRTDDIPKLLDHFLKLIDTGLPLPRFSEAAIDALCLYEWPGNVRELKSFVERMCVLYPGAVIQPTHLMKHAIGGNSDPMEETESDDAKERDLILRTLIRHRWNQSRAAGELNIPLSTLRYRIEKHGLKRP